MHDGTVAFDDSVLAAPSTLKTWLIVAGEVCIWRAGRTRLTDGVCTASTRPHGADPGRTGRTRPAHPATPLPSTVAVTASLLSLSSVLSMKEETRWTETFYRWFESFWHWRTYRRWLVLYTQHRLTERFTSIPPHSFIHSFAHLCHILFGVLAANILNNNYVSAGFYRAAPYATRYWRS